MFVVAFQLLVVILPLVDGTCHIPRTKCPPQSPAANCKAPPCEVSKCPRYPGARCVNDYCGGCKARYYVNETEVTEYCPSDLTICPDGNRPIPCFAQPCAVTTCPAYPTANCVDDYCRACKAIFEYDGRDVSNECDITQTTDGCPADKPMVNCFQAPCDANTCPQYPNANCSDDYCGGCFAKYYVNNEEVTANCSIIQKRAADNCPPDKPVVNCFQAPCDANTCPRYPNANCSDDYCGGCFAKYYVNNEEVTAKCSIIQKSSTCNCPANKKRVACLIAPCRVNKCPRYPNAECIDDYCGGCFAKYYVNKREVTPFCPINITTCPDGSRAVQCFQEPCRATRCLAYPNAKCVNDYCGGCNARFFNNETEVTYKCCDKPPVNQCQVKEKVTCIRDACDPRFTSCPNVPTAACSSDLCQGCQPRWFLPDCKEATSACNTIIT